MILIKTIAEEIYFYNFSPKEEKNYIDFIWDENRFALKKIYKDKIHFRKCIINEKLIIEDREEALKCTEELNNYKYDMLFTPSFKKKYMEIEQATLIIKKQILQSKNNRTRIILKNYLKMCGYKRRSSEFNLAVKDILNQNNMVILSGGKNIDDIPKISLDKWITFRMTDRVG